MNLDLRGRTALVCGGSAGIGRATALELASMGADLVVLSRSAERLASLLPALREAGAPSAEAVVADLSDTVGLRAAVTGLEAQILVHNTGGPPGGRLLDESTDKLARTFAEHVLSAQVLATALLPGMEAAGYGRIVTVLSTSVREPIDNLGVSNTIRGAMASWSKSMSRELPPGITINNVLPGFTHTGRLDGLRTAISERTGATEDEVEAAWLSAVPEGRLALPEETAGVIAFLCSPAAAYIRGTSLAVDGGRMRSI